jgi:hypothetical protein
MSRHRAGRVGEIPPARELKRTIPDEPKSDESDLMPFALSRERIPSVSEIWAKVLSMCGYY